MADYYIYFQAVLIASIRWGCVLWALPFLSGRSFPMHARLILIWLGGVLYYPYALGLNAHIGAQSFIHILHISIAEFITGAALALLVAMAFAVAIMAGDMISMLSGLSFAVLIDPNGQENQTALTKWLSLMTFAIFLQTGGLAQLIVTIGHSYKVVALGHMPWAMDMETLLQGFGAFLVHALFIAMPFIAVFLLANFTLGLLARSVPQINQIIVGLPGSLLLLLLLFILAFHYVEEEITHNQVFLFSKMMDLFAGQPA